ncbi:hypothetical protein N9219_03735 [bacterium]|nr:hypothetical protein [bacterium]
MKSKLSICGLITLLIFFFSYSYAQDWSRTPRVSDTSNHWRKTPKISKYPGSKFGWQKDRGHRRSRSWKHKPRHWKKRIWIFNPVYGRYSGFDNYRYDYGSVQQQVIKWVPSANSEKREPLPEEKKEFTKPQIETVSKELIEAAESADVRFQHNSDGITIIGSEGSFRIDKNVPVRPLITPGGSIKIYSSN